MLKPWYDKILKWRCHFGNVTCKNIEDKIRVQITRKRNAKNQNTYYKKKKSEKLNIIHRKKTYEKTRNKNVNNMKRKSEK